MTMRIASVLSAVVLAAVALKAQAPPGWRASSETQVRVDFTVAHSGKASGLMRGSSASDFVTLRQSIKTDDFRGNASVFPFMCRRPSFQEQRACGCGLTAPALRAASRSTT